MEVQFVFLILMFLPTILFLFLYYVSRKKSNNTLEYDEGYETFYSGYSCKDSPYDFYTNELQYYNWMEGYLKGVEDKVNRRGRKK